MRRVGDKGVEVYVSKLKDNTKFYQDNKSGRYVFLKHDRILKIVDEELNLQIIDEDKTMNIITNEFIPYEAYVYKSGFYLDKIKIQAYKLNMIQSHFKNRSLVEEDKDLIIQALATTVNDLNKILSKFRNMEAEK